MLDLVIYDVEFPDGAIHEYECLVNLIAENMMMQYVYLKYQRTLSGTILGIL